MAFDVSWSHPALADVEEIARYIARDSPQYAGALTRRFFEAADVLTGLPYIGRMVPERKEERYREVIVARYRLVYRVTGSSVVILGVIDGARRFENAVGERLPPSGHG